jgi:hypothetical protein
MRISARLAASTFLSSSLLFGFASVNYAADLPAIDVGPGPVAEEDLPAVSGLNGKIAAFGGWLDDDTGDTGIGGIMGALSVPLGHRFGFQADGMIASSHSDFVGEVGGHLFWRDPSTGLIGIYGEYVTRNDPDWDTWRIGVQGEAYLGNVSLEGVVGYENTDLPAALGSDDDDVFAYLDAAYYLDDNFRIALGYRRLDGINIGAAGMEYQLPTSVLGVGTSVFAEGRIGEDDYAAVWGGIRLYLGQEGKSLIRRHREDDPGGFGDENLWDLDEPVSPECSFCSPV